MRAATYRVLEDPEIWSAQNRRDGGKGQAVCAQSHPGELRRVLDGHLLVEIHTDDLKKVFFGLVKSQQVLAGRVSFRIVMVGPRYLVFFVDQNIGAGNVVATRSKRHVQNTRCVNGVRTWGGIGVGGKVEQGM